MSNNSPDTLAELRWPDGFIDKVICGDCFEIMKLIPDKSVDLIIADPPYNIKKDSWDRIDNYIEWIGKIFKAYERILKDNGSFYWFHNYMPNIAKLMLWLEENTKFIFKQFIVWNKKFPGSSWEGYLQGYIVVNGLRNYEQMAEYLLFYTFQDKTGLTAIKLDTNKFSSLRQYFKDYQKALGLNKREIINILGQRADHCFRWNSSQWDLPTPETYADLVNLPIYNGFKRRKYEDLRQEYEDLRQEYEDLRQEYEDLRYVFNNQKTHHSIWNYDIEPKNGHLTPKPLKLIENIILHSSNWDHIILDSFLGSGTTAVVCKELSRHFIGIEINPDYCKIAKRRLAQTAYQPELAL